MYGVVSASGFTCKGSVCLTTQDSSQLKDLWKKICHNSTGMEFQDHRYWLRTYPNCIVGKELVNWLLRNGTVSTRCGILTFFLFVYLLEFSHPIKFINNIELKSFT